MFCIIIYHNIIKPQSLHLVNSALERGYKTELHTCTLQMHPRVYHQCTQQFCALLLLFQVKRFYKFLMADTPRGESAIPQYHQWFIPCVRHWLKEYQHSALLFVNNAWDDDKNNDKVGVGGTLAAHLSSHTIGTCTCTCSSVVECFV